MYKKIYAHPTYEKCPSDLQKVPIRPTKSAHPTYEKCPSDLRKMPIRPTKLSGRHATKAAECRSDGQEDMPIRPTAVVGQMLQ